MPASIAGQEVDFNPNMQRALEEMVQLRYPDLQRSLARERRQNPQNRAADYLEASSLCIRIFAEERPESLEEQQERLDELTLRLEELPQHDPYRGVVLGEIQLARAILNAKFGSRISASWLFYKAYGNLKESYQKHPDFAPAQLPWGVLSAAIGSLPSDYRSIASFLGFQGDTQAGLRLIRGSYQQISADPEMAFFKPFFGFVYVFVQYQLTGDESPDIESLGLEVEKSSFFIYLQSRIYLSAGRPKSALELLEQRPRGAEYLDFPFLNYMAGKVALVVQSAEAPTYLHRYLGQLQGANYRASTYRFLAWHHLLEGHRDSADWYRQRILSLDDIATSSDEQAHAEAQRGFNPSLVRARLQFDAGEYGDVLQTLDAVQLSTCCQEPWEIAEYHYRRGRAFQEQEQWSRALREFRAALTVNGAPANYATGNSALQRALILERLGRREESREYFQKALIYKSYPFYEGIHQKAKTGLDRL